MDNVQILIVLCEVTVVKIEMKIAIHLSAYALCARFIFLNGKNMDQAYIANSHVFSCRQSCKTTESEDAHANEGRQKRI